MTMRKCRYQGDNCDNWTSDGLRWGIDMVWDGPRDFHTGLSTLVPHPSPVCRPCLDELLLVPLGVPPFWHAREIGDEQFLSAIVCVQTLHRIAGRADDAASRWDVACVLAGRVDLVGTAEAVEDQPGVPPKVLLAKAARLIGRTLIAGCACGCRGDWEVYQHPDPEPLARIPQPLISEDTWQAAVARCDCDQPNGLHAALCRTYRVAEGQYTFNEAEATLTVDIVAAERNPEQDVLDAIDQLVDEQLAAGPTDDYSKPYSERCPKCGGSWHGLQRGTCPGATGIEGNPLGGENRQLVAAPADEGGGREGPVTRRFRERDPLRRAHRAVEGAWDALRVIADVPEWQPPGRRPQHPTELVHCRLDEDALANWSFPVGPVEPLRMRRVLIRCVVRWLRDDVWEYQVHTSMDDQPHHAYQGAAMSREFLQSGMTGLVSVLQLTYLPGFSAGLVVESDGTVVADIMRPDGTVGARMGFGW